MTGSRNTVQMAGMTWMARHSCSLCHMMMVMVMMTVTGRSHVRSMPVSTGRSRTAGVGRAWLVRMLLVGTRYAGVARAQLPMVLVRRP